VWVLGTVGGATSEAVFVGESGGCFMVGGMLSLVSLLSAEAVIVGGGGEFLMVGGMLIVYPSSSDSVSDFSSIRVGAVCLRP
jgi:hypothetical protein